MEEKKVLIIEDDVALLKAMSSKLRKEGIQILEAKNGEDGLKTALEQHPDLILLDLLMPKKSGLQTLHELRKDKWGLKVPVIVVTNLPTSSEKDEAADKGVINYFTKSNIRLEDLVSSVKRQLGMQEG